MPTYDMKNVKTGEVKEMFLKISEKEAMVESGEWEQVHTSAADIITHHGNIISKTSGDWRNLLSNIKKGSGRGNNINTY